ncbi:MAG TPA: flippase [Candidatus Saccharimonadales bacterium]|nr:flippase [Candidatus Saccharimonadales bacterium]
MKLNHIALKIGGATLIQSIGKFIAAGLSFISVALLTRYLGTSGYGDFTLIFSYLAFFSLISDFGLQLVTVKELASAKEKIENLYGTYLGIKIALGIISSVLALIILFLFPYSNQLKIGIGIGVVAVFVSGMMGYFNSIFQARVRLDLITLFDLVSRFFSLITIILFISLHLNFYYIVSTVLIGNLVSFLFAAVLLKDTVSNNYDFVLAKRLLFLSVPIGITSLLSTLYFKVDTIILSLLRSATDVGIYSLSYKILENILVFWGFYMAATYPLLARYKSEKNSRYTTLLKSSVILALVSSIPIVIISFIFAPLAIYLFGGSQFVQSIIVLRILLFSLPLLFLNNTFYNFYVIEEFNSVIIVGMTVSFIVNVYLNLIFIPKYSYIGASYVTILSEVILLASYIVGLRFLKKEKTDGK